MPSGLEAMGSKPGARFVLSISAELSANSRKKRMHRRSRSGRLPAEKEMGLLSYFLISQINSDTPRVDGISQAGL